MLDSALTQLPIIGDQFRRPEGLTGSTSTIIIGSLAALYGASGSAAASQNALNIAWSVPRNSRPNPFLLRLRSLLLVSVVGLAILGLTTLSVLASNTTVIDLLTASALRWMARVLSILVLALLLGLLLRLGPADGPRTRSALPGALLIALLWHLLQQLGRRSTSPRCWPRRPPSTRPSAWCSV